MKIVAVMDGTLSQTDIQKKLDYSLSYVQQTLRVLYRLGYTDYEDTGRKRLYSMKIEYSELRDNIIDLIGSVDEKKI